MILTDWMKEDPVRTRNRRIMYLQSDIARMEEELEALRLRRDRLLAERKEHEGGGVPCSSSVPISTCSGGCVAR